MVHPQIFISYKRDHTQTAEMLARVEAALSAGAFDIRRDTAIDPGARWSNELYHWLMDCSAAIALVGAEPALSEWCRREWWVLRERSLSDGTPLIPISVDSTRDTGGILDEFQVLRPADDALLELTQLQGLKAARPSAASYLAAHRGWLRWQFNEARVMGREPFSLADVYVETECGRLLWEEVARDKEPREPFHDDEENGGRHDLVETVMEHLTDPSQREMVAVQGAPGAGKSTFALRLANALIDRGMKPVLVRFNEFRLMQFARADEMIGDAVRIGPVDEEPPRPREQLITDDLLDEQPVPEVPGVCPTVIILDGWDEVSLTGNTNYKAQLSQWLPKFRDAFTERPGHPVRLVITGRPSVEVRTSGVLRANTPLLTLRPMRPEALEKFARSVAKHLDAEAKTGADDCWAMDLGRLEALFAVYRTGWRETTSKLERSEAFDVLGSPLLAFLTFRTLADYDGDADELVREPSALYHALIETTVEHAGKDADAGIGPTVRQGGERLRRLLHQVAGVMTILGQEAVSFAELEHRFKDDEAFRDWSTRDGVQTAVDDATARSVLHELIVSFYFKGGNTGIGCEFLHKSFREFLFADSVLAVLLDLSEGERGPLEGPQQKYWEDYADDRGQQCSQYEATRRLSRLLAPQWMTLEVRGHLFWLVEESILAEPERWQWLRDLLLDVYIWWAEGVHLRPQPVYQRGSRSWDSAYVEDLLRDSFPFVGNLNVEPTRSTAADGHLGEALMQLTALVHDKLRGAARDCDPENSLRAYYRSYSDGVRFRLGGDGFAKHLFARVNAVGWRPTGTFGATAYLAGVDLGGADLGGADLGGANLGGANLHQAYLRRANLFGANLGGSDLGGANFGGANLVKANLRWADLGEANLRWADLGEADLHEADLRGANLDGAYLHRANLRRAYLGGADLGGADLSGADLRAADLRAADLGGANLGGAKLHRAYLRRADMRGANLGGAKLHGANLRDADLRGANLFNADCNRALIKDARLQSVDLSNTHGLVQSAVNEAHGSIETKLPQGLERPDHWTDKS